MGWSHSVFLAQACHEHILNTYTRLDRGRHQVYIDDILIGPNQHASLNYIAVADKNLPPKGSKVFDPCNNGVNALV